MNCHDMKTGSTYECTSCGLKIQVVNQCNCDSCDACTPNELQCCGSRLTQAA